MEKIAQIRGRWMPHSLTTRFAIAFFVAATIWPLVGASRSLTGVTVEWAPHYGSTLEDGGALTVIVKEAMQRAGHAADIRFIPWNRALKVVEEGSKDFVMGAYYNEARDRTYIYSDPIYSVDLGLIALRSSNIPSIDGLRDLQPYRIGVSRGFANTEEFDQADYLNKDIASSPTLNLRKLFRQRIDLAVGALDIFRHQARLEDMDINELHFLHPPLQSNALHLMASRNIRDGKQIIADFNEQLALMRDDGTLDRLLKRYLNR